VIGLVDSSAALSANGFQRTRSTCSNKCMVPPLQQTVPESHTLAHAYMYTHTRSIQPLYLCGLPTGFRMVGCCLPLKATTRVSPPHHDCANTHTHTRSHAHTHAHTRTHTHANTHSLTHSLLVFPTLTEALNMMGCCVPTAACTKKQGANLRHTCLTRALCAA